MTTAAKTDNLLDLLFDAPEQNVEAVQNAIRLAAAGEYRAAAQSLQFAADCYDIGHAWGDRAEHLSAIFRAKATIL